MDSLKIKGQIDFKIYKRFDSFFQRLALRFLNLVSPIHAQKFLDTYGVVRDAWQVNNLITTVGKAELANLAGNVSSPAYFTYLAAGTSNTAVAVGQTALGAEISTLGLSRASATVSRITTTTTNDTLQLLKIWTASGTLAVEEIGIFNASSSGVMLGRALTTTKNIASGETFTGTYKVIFA